MLRLATGALVVTVFIIAIASACGGQQPQQPIPASCFGLDGGAMTCPADDPICIAQESGADGGKTAYQCSALPSPCADDPICACLRQNNLIPCDPGSCGDGVDGIEIVCGGV